MIRWCLQGLDEAQLGTNLIPREIITDRLVRSKKPWATIRTEEMEKIEWRSGLDVPTSVENFANLTREEKWGFAEGDRLFVDAILAGGEPPVTSYDGLKSVEMTMAVYRSAKEKTAVRLEL